MVLDFQKYEIMTEAQNIKELTAGKHPAEALAIIENLLAKATSSPLLIEKGKLLWRLDRRGEAMSVYEQAARIDPDGTASLLIEHSNSIMDFFNPDLLNP